MTHHRPSDAAASADEARAAAYAAAYAAAQPDPGHRVVTVEMAAGEFDWEFVPGVSTRAWGFNGTVPGPTLEATVGDVLEIRLTNRAWSVSRRDLQPRLALDALKVLNDKDAWWL